MIISKVYDIRIQKGNCKRPEGSGLAFLKDQEVFAKITVNDEELRTAYNAPKVKLSFVIIRADRSEAETSTDWWRCGVSFKKLANSLTDTRYEIMAGSLGYITWDNTDPSFEKRCLFFESWRGIPACKYCARYSIIKVDDRIEDPFTTETEFLNRKHKLRTNTEDKTRNAPTKRLISKEFLIRAKSNSTRRRWKLFVTDWKNAKHMRWIEWSSRKSFNTVCSTRGKSIQWSNRKPRSLPSGIQPWLCNKRETAERGCARIINAGCAFRHLRKKKVYTNPTLENFRQFATTFTWIIKRNEVLASVPVADSKSRGTTRRMSRTILNRTRNDVQRSSWRVIPCTRLGKKSKAGEISACLPEILSRNWSAKNEGMMGSLRFYFGELKDTLWKIHIGKGHWPSVIRQVLRDLSRLAKKDARRLTSNAYDLR